MCGKAVTMEKFRLKEATPEVFPEYCQMITYPPPACSLN